MTPARTGGFWAGMLCYARAATKNDRYSDLTHDYVLRSAFTMGSPTVLRGLLFWYGVGVDCVLNG